MGRRMSYLPSKDYTSICPCLRESRLPDQRGAQSQAMTAPYILLSIGLALFVLWLLSLAKAAAKDDEILGLK